MDLNSKQLGWEALLLSTDVLSLTEGFPCVQRREKALLKRGGWPAKGSGRDVYMEKAWLVGDG